VASLLHVTTTEGIIIINAFVLLITAFGYDMFHSYNRIVTWLSTAVFLAILGKLLTILPAHLQAGDNSAGNILLAISVFVAWQVTWAPYVSDYSRYMPENTSSRRVFSYTYIGSVVGASLVMCIGAIAAVVADKQVTANAPDYLGGLLSVKWLFLIVFILGVGSGNFGNLYGPYLTFMAIISPSGKLASKTTGRPARLIATTVVAIIGTLIAIKASSNFISDLSNFLVFTLYLLVPWTAINLVDYFFVRRGRYAILDEFNPNGIYGRWGTRGLTAFIIGLASMAPFFLVPGVFTGPAATALGGVDVSAPVGLVVSGLLYFALTRSLDLEAERSAIDASERTIAAQMP